MKNVCFHAAVLLMFFSNLTNAQYILKLRFEQMDDYVGKRLVTRVTEINTGKEVGRKTIDPIDSAAFSFDLYVLLEGRSYKVDNIVDVNGSGDYDPPPVDHAWSDTINNAVQHTTLIFIPDTNFTNTGLPDPFPFSTYDAVWGGKWFNLTFGSTDSIEGLFQLSCDSFYGYFSTSGVFGNPAQVEFDTSGILPDDTGNGSDTIVVHLDPPWTGQIMIIDEQILADLMNMGIRLQFTGTIGAKQILALYTIEFGGNPFANGYFYLRELDINSSTPELMIELNAHAEVSCFDAEDGFLSTSAIGGMPGYTYLWSNGEITSQINNLAGGDYSVTVTDSLGCTSEMTYSVSEPAQIVTTWFTDQVSCNGLCDGSIDIIMIGGVPPYFFSWSTGSTTEDEFDLCAGTYNLTVTDASGCVASAPITVFAPDRILLESLVISNETDGQSNGEIIITVTGGTPPFEYSIDGSSYQISNQFSGLLAGFYTIFIRDNNGCIVLIPALVEQTITAIDELQANFSLYPNPTSTWINLESDIPLEIDVLDIHGQNIWHEEKSEIHRIKVDDLVPGVYFLRISDGAGLTYRKVIVQ